MEIPPPLTPPHKGGGDFAPCRVAQISTILAGKAAPASPSPLWGGDRGGGKKPRKFHMRLPYLQGEGTDGDGRNQSAEPIDRAAPICNQLSSHHVPARAGDTKRETHLMKTRAAVAFAAGKPL